MHINKSFKKVNTSSSFVFEEEESQLNRRTNKTQEKGRLEAVERHIFMAHLNAHTKSLRKYLEHFRDIVKIYLHLRSVYL